MEPSEHRTFRAATPELLRVSAFIEERCAALGVPRDHALRLLLIAEELFLNSVLHGYGGDFAGEVCLAVARAGADELELTVEDSARAFDPFSAAPPVSASANPEARPVGQVGLVLVSALASRRRYQRRADKNVVTVALSLR